MYAVETGSQTALRRGHLGTAAPGGPRSAKPATRSGFRAAGTAERAGAPAVRTIRSANRLARFAG
jgi:hypothetical protein